MVTSQYYGLSSTLCGSLGIQQTTPFIKYGMSAFTSTALQQLVTTGVSFSIGDKKWHKNVYGKEALVQLLVGSCTAGCLGEFGVHILGEAYDPCKLPTFLKEGSCSWAQISTNKLASHSALLLAKEAEHISLNMFSDEKWTLKACFARLLIHEISSLSAHSSAKLGKMYGGKKLDQFYSGRELSYWQHKIGHSLLAGSHQASLSAVNYLLGDDDNKFHYEQCLLNVFASSCGAAIAEIFAERKLFKNKTMHEFLEDSGRFESVLSGQFKERGEKAAFFGKLMGLISGIVTLNAGALTASYTGSTNAIDHNFIIVLGVICAGLTAYDLYDAYKQGGVKGLLKQLGFEVAINITGSCFLKYGGKIYRFSNAHKAVEFIYKKYPLIGKIAGKPKDFIQLLIKSEEKIINKGLMKISSKSVYINEMPWETGKKAFAHGWKFEIFYSKILNTEASHLGKTYPVFDFFYNGSNISLKTMNLSAQSYRKLPVLKNVLRRYCSSIIAKDAQGQLVICFNTRPNNKIISTINEIKKESGIRISYFYTRPLEQKSKIILTARINKGLLSDTKQEHPKK